MAAYGLQIDTPELGLVALAEKQHGVVARAQLRALGLGENAIQRRVRQGRLQRLHRGVYAVGHRVLRPEGRMLAAVLACGPRAVLSHCSAAALWALRPTDRAPVDVTTTARSGERVSGIDLHRARSLDPADVTEHHGIPVTTVARTLVDLAGPPAFTRSELESHFLTLCADRGLPQPSLNAAVCGYEVDFLWSHARLIVETDGYAYHHTRQAFEHDRQRDGELKRAGYEVLRVTYWQVKRESEWVASTIQALLKRRCGDL
jgi:hypothetical protein